MNVQSARILNGVSRITSFTPMSNSVPNVSLKTVKNYTDLCGQGTQLHVYRHTRTCIWRTSAKCVNNSAAMKFTAIYGCHQKLYSAKSTPQKCSDERDAKHQNGLAGGEVDDETNFVKDETGGETRKRGQMNRCVRRAAKATEKMKEKVVKDGNENIFTIPNLLSTTRLVMSPVLGYLVIQECYTIGACLFVVAGITDLNECLQFGLNGFQVFVGKSVLAASMSLYVCSTDYTYNVLEWYPTIILDGFIARNFKNQQSVLGSIIDPLADKCLVAILTLSLTVSGLIPVPLTILMVSRDVGLVGSVFYLRYQSLPPPRTVSRFFDITHATVQLKPTTISKLNTAVQLGLVGFTLAAPVFHYVDHSLLHALWYTTAATTILSGFSYVFSKDAFKFMRK